MVKLTKIYTRTGDKGLTHLAGKHRVKKTNCRVESYGTIDELNACVGMVVSGLEGNSKLGDLKTQCIRIQNELFNVGTLLAVLKQDRRDNTPRVTEGDVLRLENEIDAMNETLPTLKSFVLPGGSEASARLHAARTVCRRAERCILHAAGSEDIDDVVFCYINRLSDWLFVAARYCLSIEQKEEQLWSYVP
ncbi:MAG: cob(I)yrinic acid a,c-diamide adenosyltransferase [Coxiellaceae bacterium]|nr:cob(I)yrinic acid a,c-diamide adenosyltransferase [Coxiellaceae bacterium]